MLDEKDFAARLTQLRVKKGVSAREMSLAIGQNVNYINNIEAGNTMPSLSGVFYICEYLKMTPSEFFDTTSDNPAELHEINELLKKLNDEQLAMVKNLIKNIIK